MYNLLGGIFMSRIKRTFTQQEKMDIINLVLKDNLTVKQVTDLHDLDRQTIHRWIKEYREFGEKAFREKDFITHEQETRKLKKELAEAKEEIEILKKAHAYFARMKRQ